MIYLRIWKFDSPPKHSVKENQKVQIDPWISKSLWYPERMIYRSTSIVYAWSDKTLLEMDALKHASGAVLRQQDSNRDWHPCRYLSKSFTETEQNYDIGNRELLAVIRALEEWQHYLLGLPHEVILLSDHKNLSYFKQPQKLNPWQAKDRKSVV